MCARCGNPDCKGEDGFGGRLAAIYDEITEEVGPEAGGKAQNIALISNLLRLDLVDAEHVASSFMAQIIQTAGEQQEQFDSDQLLQPVVVCVGLLHAIACQGLISGIKLGRAFEQMEATERHGL